MQINFVLTFFFPLNNFYFPSLYAFDTKNKKNEITTNSRVARKKFSATFGEPKRRQLSTFFQQSQLASLDEERQEQIPTLQPIYEDLMRRNMPAKFRVDQNDSVASLGQLNLQLLRLKSLAGGATIGLLKGRKVFDNGITYNIGRYGYAKTDDQTRTCSFTLTSNHTVWNLLYDDGAPVTEILFDCPATDVCCDLNCCSPTFPWWPTRDDILFKNSLKIANLGGIILSYLAFLSLIGIGIFVACIYTRCNEDPRRYTDNPSTSRMISSSPKEEKSDDL
uniref:CX domain-containing protein n=1 Tax=Romanomermis culicivorax TaxID=13658 RepID=A0A915JVN4_ROMCU